MAIKVQDYQGRVKLQGKREAQVSGADPVGRGFQQFGKGVSDIGRAATSIYAKEVRKQKTARIQDKFGQLGIAKKEILGDNQNGYVSQRGQAAIENRSSVESFYDAKAEALAKDLSDDEREEFKRLVMADKASFLDSVNQHAAREAKVYSEQSHASLIEVQKSDAIGIVLREEGGEKLAGTMAMGQAAIERHGQDAGWDPNTVELKKREFVTSTHLSVLDALLDQDKSVEAGAYLDAHRGEIDPAALAKSNAEKVVGAAVRKEEVTQLADKFLEDTEDDEGRDDMNAAIIAVSEQYADDVEKRDDVIVAMGQSKARRIKSLQAADAEYLAIVSQQISEKGGFNPKASKEFQLMSHLGKASARKMMNAERRASQKAQDDSIRNAIAEFNALPLFGANGEDQATVSILSRFSHLAKRGRDILTGMQNDVGRMKGLNDAGVTDVVNGVMLEKGIKKKAKSDDRPTAILKYVMNEAQVWSEKPENKGKKGPGPSLIRKWTDEATENVDVPGTFYGTNKVMRIDAIRKGKAEEIIEPDEATDEAERGEDIDLSADEMGAPIAPGKGTVAQNTIASGKKHGTVKGKKKRKGKKKKRELMPLPPLVPVREARPQDDRMDGRIRVRQPDGTYGWLPDDKEGKSWDFLASHPKWKAFE